jgi:hypothetical protein
VLPDDALEGMLERTRTLRARVDSLPDGPEIDAAIRAEVKFLPHPPEPPPRHGELIAEVLALVRDDRLSPEQAARLETAFFGDAHPDPT